MPLRINRRPGSWFSAAGSRPHLPHDSISPQQGSPPGRVSLSLGNWFSGLLRFANRDKDALRLLFQKELSGEQIAILRKAVANFPAREQGNAYRQIAAKVTYRNQRDNAGRYVIGDKMCNVTSIAMALNQLGIGVAEAAKQFEDLLDEIMVEGGMGSRYEQEGQCNVANAFGADAVRMLTPPFSDGDDACAWFKREVRPRFERGDAATMSIMAADTPQGHIVRLEWVEDDGLKVDDPFGTLICSEPGIYCYLSNDHTCEKGEGARGEDNNWSWETVACIAKSRYVQFYSRPA